jgi:hypothetical protein
MDKEFVIGDRIRISTQYHWAQGVTGTIKEPPEPVNRMVEGWQGPWRIVEALKGPLRFYWVEFDEPQRDAEGDGPYFGAEIDSAFLSLERLI